MTPRPMQPRPVKRLAVAALLVGLARPAAADMRDDYQLIMWQPHTPAEIAGLARLGFTGTALIASGGHIDPAAQAIRVAGGLPWYLENVATDFFAPYHRYVPGKSVTWLFDAAKARRRANPADASVFERAPSLSDPAWIAAIDARLTGMVQAEAPFRPLFYSLGDETGIGDLAAAWDADISAPSLAAMRQWLRTQYPDLAALNRQWATDFASWDAVVPQLTDAAMARTDDNWSAWADFKTWMDVAFAAASRHATDTVHAADPHALSALEGGQLPGWGGYDYARLAGSVDVMEIYDVGDSVQLAAAFNPALIQLRSSGDSGAAEVHAAWRHLVHGGRGTIVWDEANDVVAPDGTPRPRGLELAALAAGLRAAAPTLFAAQPLTDPVAVLQSQPSFRTGWMLAHRALGPAWSDRDAEAEYADTPWRAARHQLLERLGALGVQPRILSPETLAAGLTDAKLLFLPQAIALSQADVDAIAAFAARGGHVLADVPPGAFDQHSRRRPALPLPDAVRIAPALAPDGIPDGTGPTPANLDALAAVLADAGVPLRARLRTADGATAALDQHWLRTGAATLLSVQTRAPAAAPMDVTVTLAAPARAHLLHQPAPAQPFGTVILHLDPAVPSLLLLEPEP